MVSLASQMHALFMTILAGVTVGLLFDIYRVCRGLLRPRAWLSWITDFLFWLVATPAVFVLLLLGNWGELRLYVLVGLLLGGILYFGVFSPVVLDGLVAVSRGLVRGLGAVGRGSVALIGWPLRWARELAFFVSRRRGLGGPRWGRGLMLGRWRPGPPRLAWWPRMLPPHLARLFRR